MKLRDLIARADPAEATTNYDPDLFCAALGVEPLGYDETFIARVTSVFVQKWLCTDTWVGLQVHYLDGEPVAVSWQNARKSDIELWFVSANAAERMRGFLLSLTTCKPRLIDPDGEVGETYSVEYANQLLVKAGRYKGEWVEVLRNANKDYTCKEIVVLTPYSEELTIDVADLKIPYHVRPE
jgi:hypothetical protein